MADARISELPALGATPADDDLIPVVDISESPDETKNMTVAELLAAKVVAFGGTGADGPLSASSGATNIDLGGLAVVIKNYTSISLTGTASLTFSNPHANGTIIILKSQGNVVLTSSATPMIDLRGLGGSGGATTTAPDGGQANGAPGKQGTGIYPVDTTLHYGGGGTGSTAGVAGLQLQYTGIYSLSDIALIRKNLYVVCGNGGGAGASGVAPGGYRGGDGGAGGRGGGAMYIECGGDLNFTGQVNYAGGVGTAGSVGGDRGSGGGGGGGGSEGMFIAIYKTATATSGTFVGGGGNGAAGGASNNSTSGSGGVGGAGGGGAGHYGGAGGIGGAGGTVTVGGNGGNAPANSGGGGGGGGGGREDLSGTARAGGSAGNGGTTGTPKFIGLNTSF